MFLAVFLFPFNDSLNRPWLRQNIPLQYGPKFDPSLGMVSQTVILNELNPRPVAYPE